MNPMRAKIERRTENCRVRDAAPTEPVGRLQQDEASIGGGDAPGRRDTCRAGADDRHVHVRRGLRAQQCRCRDNGRGGGEEKAPAWSRHGA